MLIKIETTTAARPSGEMTLAELRAEFDRQAITAALSACNGVKYRAASQLGITREGLFRLMRRLGMNGGVWADPSIRVRRDRRSLAGYGSAHVPNQDPKEKV